MFGLFGSSVVTDPQLGELRRSRGRWRGSLAVEAGVSVPLALAGSRSAPDERALEAARAIPAHFAAWRPAIERALFEHVRPYTEALADGAPAPEAVPRLETPDDVWPNATLLFVSVGELLGVLTTELGYTTAWDDEHTLGARFQGGELVELNGSVLPA